MALLRMLRDIAISARDDSQRDELARQVSLIVAGIPSEFADIDAEQVKDLAERADLAIAADLQAAYLDRSGETRSL